MVGSTSKISAVPTHMLEQVEYDHYKDQYNLLIRRADGSSLIITESATHGKPTARHLHFGEPEEQTKESPHDQEEIVEAGTEFLMKVTEEAVLDAMAAISPFTFFDREANRELAEKIVHGRLKAYTTGETGDVIVSARLREGDPDEYARKRAAHGAPAPVSKPGPLIHLDPGEAVEIFPADRYDPSKPFEGSHLEFCRYLDATQGK